MNDGHFHSPKHVWNRAESAPNGPPVKNSHWPATSPPADEPADKSVAEKKEDTKKEEAKPEAKKEETKTEAKTEAKKALAQEEPEKVHTLEPEVYQGVANNNTPNKRTTFYAESH